jgi:uncharacterized membrane protein
MSRARLIARIALFAALIYVTSWSLAAIPDVKVSFFIMFTAGFVWGTTAGAMVGAVGTALFSMFNPYGPTTIPMMIAQISGSALCGAAGALYQYSGWYEGSPKVVRIGLVLCGVVCTALYYVPVNVVDAWLFQPFWPRLIASLPFTGLALIANALIFPLLFGVTRFLYDREKARS